MSIMCSWFVAGETLYNFVNKLILINYCCKSELCIFQLLFAVWMGFLSLFMVEISRKMWCDVCVWLDMLFHEMRMPNNSKIILNLVLSVSENFLKLFCVWKLIIFVGLIYFTWIFYCYLLPVNPIGHEVYRLYEQ